VLSFSFTCHFSPSNVPHPGLQAATVNLLFSVLNPQHLVFYSPAGFPASEFPSLQALMICIYPPKTFCLNLKYIIHSDKVAPFKKVSIVNVDGL